MISIHIFRQILPVIQGGNRAEIVDSAIKSSHLWNNFQSFTLNENLRLRGNNQRSLKEYDDWLLLVGSGDAPTCSQVLLPADKVEFIVQDRHGVIRSMIYWLFGNDLQVNFVLHDSINELLRIIEL